MSFIGITQRVTVDTGTQEVRDCLSQDWGVFFAALGLHWAALPNRKDEALFLADKLSLSGIVLSGGNDIGENSARDDTEIALLETALAKDIPVIGVCRGFQLIHTFFGGTLVELDRSLHVRSHHAVESVLGIQEVNSYHRWGFSRMDAVFDVLAKCSADRTIEAARYGKITGIMWHPEREKKPSLVDIQLFSNLLKG